MIGSKNRWRSWGLYSLGAVSIVCLILISLLAYYFFPPKITEDANGYKTIRVFLDAAPTEVTFYRKPWVKMLLQNAAAHIEEKTAQKIKFEFVKHRAHVAIFVTDESRLPPNLGHVITRFHYKYSHPFSQKVIFQFIDTPSSAFFHTAIREYPDYGLDFPCTAMAVGPQYKHFDPRYVYLPYYALTLDLLTQYPTEQFVQKALDTFLAERSALMNENERSRFCAFIFSHYDLFGLREESFYECSKIGPVDALGGLLHNNDSLWIEQTAYINAQKQNLHSRNLTACKLKALARYKFNICIENTDVQGYVSEKLFDTLHAGCIPIYAGCGNQPIPLVINPDAVLFWSYDGKNANTLARIQELNSNPAVYKRFIAQSIFQPTASQYITQTLTHFYSHLCSVLEHTINASGLSENLLNFRKNFERQPSP